MKALVTNTADLQLSPLPRVRAVADSAISRQREPIWLDTDSGGVMCAIVCPCYRIGRLGLNINARFARRYIDAVGLAALVVPEQYAAAPTDAPEILYVCNGAMVLGEETVPEQLGDEAWQLEVSATAGNGAAITRQITTAGMEFVDLAVPRLSQLMTFKTGDRILDTGHSLTITLGKGTHASGRLQSLQLLQCKAL